MSNRLPNFLFLGPDKAGSSWLHSALSNHPEAYITPAKDLYFFDQYYERGPEWYASRFRAAGPEHRVVGEVCHGYLLAPDAASRIADMLPDVRVMACLRDPVDRIRSWYQHWQKHGLMHDVDVTSAVQMKPQTMAAGAYWTQLERYRRLLGRERMHVAVFDDLREDPQCFLDALTGWLGLSRLGLREEQKAPQRRASEPRNPAIARTVKRLAVGARRARLDALVGRVKSSPAVESTLYRPLASGAFELPEGLVEKIRRDLHDEIEKCERDYGLDLLTRWGWR